MFVLKKISLGMLLLSLALVTQSLAQKPEKSPSNKVNFSHSANPPAKNADKSQNIDTKSIPKNTAKTLPINAKVKTGRVEDVKFKNSTDNNSARVIETDNDIFDKDNRPATVANTKTKNGSIANKTRELSKRASRANLSLTEIYKVGVGDVLYINLQDQSAKYYTVLIDGTIDYPLAGKLVSVIDLTTDEIEELLRESIKLYKNPEVTVKVREYVSHKINVAGLARKGVHYLQREAMPLVVVKTMVGVNSDAIRVVIERENSEAKTIDLSSDEANAFLIVKGDKLTFEKDETTIAAAGSGANQFYFVGEDICEGGKKTFHKGLTLVQAVFDVCGQFNTKLKNVVITRKTKSGKFISKKYNYKDILRGNEKDPILQANDMIDAEK